MSLSICRRIRDQISLLRDQPQLPFSDLLDADLVEEVLEEQGVKYRDRIFSPQVTLWTFLTQVLSLDHCCRKAVARLIAYRTARGEKACSADSGSYCKARQRLALGVITGLFHRLVHAHEERVPKDWLWKGRKTLMVDGSTVSMPDTQKNQEAFPQPKTQARGVGFPIARVVAIISLATGVLRGLAIGPYKGKGTGETALLRQLLDGLKGGEVLLGDRYFASYFGISSLVERGADGLFRMHQRRKFDFRKGRSLGIDDHIVTWTKPNRPAWMNEETYAQIPEEMKVRELRFQVQQPGFRADELVLVTTMLDAEEYTTEELARLYLERWNIELDLRAIKCVMQMDVLRCETPEMVIKEIWMHSLAYNLIRGVMAAAAEAHEKKPRQISFAGALQTMEAFREVLNWAPPETRRLLVDVMLRAI
ncbi:MAG TPA: IS4 family transposase, partial [Candidatus Methylomirabilis sp.]|nr:IS4 family transposase [Candidatus Methylomirabilis sp.]